MYRAVKHQLVDHNALVSGIPALMAATAEFTGKLADLEIASLMQVANIEGASTLQSVQRERLTNATVRVTKALRVFAEVTRDLALIRRVDLRRSDFERMQDEEFAGICRDIAGLAGEYRTALTHHGLNDAAISLPGELAADFAHALESRPENARGHDPLAESFTDLDLLLNQRLDPLVGGIAEPHPDFVRSYRTARETTAVSLSTFRV